MMSTVGGVYLHKLVHNLKGPSPVVEIQRFFGIIHRKPHANTNRNGQQQYTITNYFWYYLFVFGTALGGETFYCSFIPFLFWNIDGAVGRRVVLVWAIVMYIGQSMKDMLRWERPGPPVARLQDKWSLEYGMPSTHAMVGVSIPFSVVLYTMHRYQYNVPVGICIATVWCSLICISRLYLGMHTLLDIVAGLSLAILLMIPLVPLVDTFDKYFLTSSLATSPLLFLVVSILLIFYYPNSGHKWTPTRGDTTMMVSVCVGVFIGSWLNYNSGVVVKPSELQPPYVILWPSYTQLGCILLRTTIGFLLVLLTRSVVKVSSCWFICCVIFKGRCTQQVRTAVNTQENHWKIFADLTSKYVTCAMIGFNILYTIPQLFRYMKIDRATFFTEI